MVDGVRMVFRKDKMLKRVAEEDSMRLVGVTELAFMDNLDGCEVSTACWSRRVKGAPVYSCTGKNGKTFDVYEGDCEAVSEIVDIGIGHIIEGMRKQGFGHDEISAMQEAMITGNFAGIRFTKDCFTDTWSIELQDRIADKM